MVKTSDVVSLNTGYDISDEISKEFPSGYCNAWGVPEGASSMLRNIKKGDYFLLLKSRSGNGSIPVLCRIKIVLNGQNTELSKYLWDDDKFALVFLFDTEIINYTWTEMLTDMGYKEKYRPAGSVVRLTEDRLERFDGATGFIEKIRGKSVPSDEQKDDIKPDHQFFDEGQRARKEISYFKRNPELVEAAKKLYGYTCNVCSFNFEEKYGDIGKEFIECHHTKPLSENESQGTYLKDVITICSNCHKMIHKRRPAYSAEELKLLLK